MAVCLLALCIFVMPASALAQQGGDTPPSLLQRLWDVARSVPSSTDPCPVHASPSVGVSPPQSPLADPLTPAPSDAPTRNELLRARRVRARAVCERETVASMREACYACAERGGHLWISYGNASLAQAAVTAAADQGVSLSDYRCQATHAASSHRAITALGARVARIEANVAGLSLGNGGTNFAAPTPNEMRSMSDILAYVAGAMVQMRTVMEEYNAQRELDACIIDHRTDPRVICAPVRDRLHQARIATQDIARRYGSVDQLRSVASALQRVQRACGIPAGSNECDVARAALDRLVEILRPAAEISRSPTEVARAAP